MRSELGRSGHITATVTFLRAGVPGRWATSWRCQALYHTLHPV